MSTFSKETFDPLHYDSFRPLYPASFYRILLEYTGKSVLKDVVDLGCGTGVATFPLLSISQNVLGLDPSTLMIDSANGLKHSRLQELGISDEDRIKFMVGTAESFEAPPDSFDLIAAAECIQWFTDYDKFFTVAAQLLRPGATLAYWYYMDPLIVDFEGPVVSNVSKNTIIKKAMAEYERMVYTDDSCLCPYFEQPGFSILKGFLVEVDKHIPHDLFTDIKIRKYIPGKNTTYRDDDLQIFRKEMKLGEYIDYVSTYNTVYDYEAATGKSKELMGSFLNILEKELGWDREKTTLSLEWEAGYTFMKKRHNV